MVIVFSIAPARLGGLDLLIPLFSALKEKAPFSKVHLLFLEERPLLDLKKNPFLEEQFKCVVDVKYLTKKNGTNNTLLEKIFNKCLKFSTCFVFVLRLASARNKVLLHSRLKRNRLSIIFHWINHVTGGRTFCHFNSMIMSGDLSSSKRQRVEIPCDHFLFFGPHDKTKLKEIGMVNRAVQIGYPRFFCRWQKSVKEAGVNYVSGELERYNLPRNSEIVSFFLGSTVEGIFSRQELENWLIHSLNVVRRKIPNAFIFIKPHPMQDMGHLERVIKATGLSRVGVTHLNAGLLASRSKFVITHHTSTILDAMCMKVPTILFLELTPEWLKVHPEGASYISLKPLWAKKPEELAKCVNAVLSSKYSPPDVLRALGHYEDLSFLMER